MLICVIVEMTDELLVAQSCEERIALLVGQIPESERDIIEITCTELHRAFHHVCSDRSFAHSRELRSPVQYFLILFKAHTFENPYHITRTQHLVTSF